MKYNNKFNGVDKSILYNYLNNSLNLSYSSMDNYYHCAFKFYLSNILKLDYFEETIQIYNFQLEKQGSTTIENTTDKVGSE